MPLSVAPASILLPRILRIGGGASRQLPDVLSGLGLSRPFLITDRFLWEQGPAQALVERIANAGVATRVYADTVPDPTIADVENCLEQLRRDRHDCVIGLGGGSPIDTAKMVAVLAVHGGPVSRYKVPHDQVQPGLPILAIPTTAGTGSETTRFTIITDGETDEKMLCAGSAYLPIAALVDYELTLSKPRRLSADTGLDALTHAIEAYVSRKANPFSDGMALLAMKAIAPNLRIVCSDPADRRAREAMMLGATQAGMAFSNASVALVHGMSRPIGAHFHVPHGLSNAMLLPFVTAFSAPAAPARYAECARAMGLAEAAERDGVAVARLVDELSALNADLDVPTPRTFGIDPSEWRRLLPNMAEQAIASGSPANNPRTASADQMQDLYMKAWDG